MKKKLLAILIMGMFCVIFAGCGSSKDGDTTGLPTAALSPAGESASVSVSPSPEAGEAVTATPVPDADEAVTASPAADNAAVKEFAPNEKNVKLLGRTYQLADTLWLSYSASGIEFTFTGTRAEITLIGDNVALPEINEGRYCRVGIYVNDELVYDDLLKEREKTITAYESDTDETVTVKVLKLTEAPQSTLGIGKIKVTSKDGIKPAEARAHRIEFIGDSITCGFGVDDSNVNAAFSTATEDVTKTYAYKTAEALNADYSMTAMSGYGVISGYTGNSTLVPDQVIPKIYGTMGSSYGYFNGFIDIDTLSWDFGRFVPDLIVINLGTNDNSYTGNNKDKQAEFTEGYIAFLKQVRANNPDSVILCTLGMMGDTLYPCIEEAVGRYSGETGDTKVYSMKFEVQQASDGYGACWHPSEATHTKAADKLTAKIKEIMGW